jgi:hypothetical protein
MQTKSLAVVGAAVLIGSFFGTLWIMDHSGRRLESSTIAAQNNVVLSADPAALAARSLDPAKFARLKTNAWISFANSDNATALLSGWSAPEPWGVWSNGFVAELGFVPEGVAGKTLAFQIACNIFVAPQAPKQKVELWAGTVKLADVELSQSGTISGSIPAGGLRDGAPLIVTLKIPTAIAPSEIPALKSPDPRKLGIGLISARLFEK